MSLRAAVHAALELWGMIFCLAFFLGMLVGGEMKKPSNRQLGGLLLVDSIQLLSDALAWMYRGNRTQFAFYIVRISNYLVYFTNYMILYMFTLYILGQIEGTEEQQKELVKYRQFMLALVFISVFILTAGQATTLFYGFNALNEYYRGQYWWMLQGFGFMGMLVNAMLIVGYRNRIHKDMYLCFLSYLLFPLAAMVIQSWIYGISLMNLAITLTLLMVCVISRTIQYWELLANQKALSDMRVRIAVSQIGPHFLFNALTTIKFLCITEPDRAAKAVDELAMYFRGNIDAMTTDQPIPFKKEVQHVQHYLSLENERFQERLMVNWDLKEMNFHLPALTLQPMVENAVKHGVLKKPEGGTVTIRSERTEKGYLVTVTDDGVGFDTSQPPADDGRSHIGVTNVRERLHEMCHGQLEIRSEIGKGTECRIWVPEEEIKK